MKRSKPMPARRMVLAAAAWGAIGFGAAILTPASGASAAALQAAPAMPGEAAATTESVAPATTSPAGEAEALQATITAVKGQVEVRDAADQPWRPAVVGMVVGQNAEFITGVRSAVQFVIPPDHTITVDRLGAVKLLTALREGDKITTQIGMKYGRTRYHIASTALQHESSIVSPSNTLLVRDTDYSDFDQRPFPAEAVALTGRVEVSDTRKRIFIGSPGGSKAKVNSQTESAATYALLESVVDPTIARARTPAEQQLVNAVLSTGAVESFDFEKGIRVVRGGRPLTDNELIPVLPGSLNFVLRWSRDADLNLGVVGPAVGSNTDSPSRTVYPIGGRDVSATGGSTPFDHRGGPNGGIEVVSWTGQSIPEGRYLIGVQKISGVDTPAMVDVFRAGGSRVDILHTAQGPGPVTTARFLATEIPPEIASGIFVGDVELFPSGSVPAAEAGRKAAIPTLAAAVRPGGVSSSFVGPLPADVAARVAASERSSRRSR